MKSSVRLSSFSKILTIGLTALLIGLVLYSLDEPSKLITLLILIAVMAVCSLLFAPRSIETTDSHIVVRATLNKLSIPLENVESVSLFQPTMGSFRLFASAGFMGYWGVFREGDIGIYQGYYGKSSDCFLITLQDGSKFVLGCESPDAMVSTINRFLAQRTQS